MPAGQLPPKTVLLSEMMRELSARPGFTEAFLAQVQGGGDKKGAAFLTPDLVDDLRQVILGKDWQRLDHFPGWTMAAINPTVRVVGHVVGKDPKIDNAATAGGAPSGNPGEVPSVTNYLDLATYAADKAATVSLDTPAQGKPFELADFQTSMGDGVLRGDGPSPLAPQHAESTRLADVLNRLSLNGFENTALFQVDLAGHKVSTPEALIAALAATGHTIQLSDARYFANFGHLHYNGQDVMMPFWIDSQIRVPNTRRPLLVPVSHAEYEWEITGPRINAAVSFYFGIDGKAEFRTMDQLDQAWVMKRHAHVYRGAEVLEVTRLTGRLVQAYQRLHKAHPALPFGGYYALGVCQDVVAAIEFRMTGKTTLFPNTADDRFFTDPRDAEVNALIHSIPKDRNGRPPQVERIFGSLPFGSSDAELATVSIPGLGADLIAVHDAWTNGTLHRTHSLRERWIRRGLYGVGFLAALGLIVWLRRRGPRQKT